MQQPFINKPKLYCGNQNVVPNGYDRLGTRYECLRKGFGAGMLAPDETRNRFKTKVQQGPVQVLNLNQLQNLATSLHINIRAPNAFAVGGYRFKTRAELIYDIQREMIRMYQWIQNNNPYM